ncbi:MAG: flavin reductase family protein [Candidatus Bathyarchaeota archaeon]|nr:MAG: flavin reductase family protein [Candidatus Bathyarchaeota archaeon]
MVRERVKDFEFVDETHRLMRSGGLFLVTAGKDGKPNAMTIGWGLVGTMWRKPFYTVAVRLSRYTHGLMEEADEFTVCLPTQGMEEALDVCGTMSGRELDKFKELGLTAEKGVDLAVPYIAECPVHYECRVVYKIQVRPGELVDELEKDVYPGGNYHILYFGEILGVYAEDNAEKKASIDI